MSITGNYFSTSTPGFKARIKRLYSDFIVEEIQEDNRICEVKCFVNKKQKEKLKLNEKKINAYLHLDLEKINKDLHLVLRDIARKMHLSRKRLSYAGIKDKRAITCQRISIWIDSLEQLQLIENLNLKGIELRNAVWQNKKIDLGMLKGNRFTITLRDIELEKNELIKRINECFKEMQEKGIPNYFGLQRFGGIREVSHLIGKMILKRKIKEAVMLFLTYPSEKEEKEIAIARKNLLETNDFKQAKKEFPEKYVYERAIIDYLIKKPNDFENAFRQLPLKIRYLFTHAYQAFIFNKIIDLRFEKGINLELQEGEPQKNGIPLGLLPGYKSELSEGIIGEIEKEVLKEENIELSDFLVKELKECSSKGARKEIKVKPENMKLIKVMEDEIFKGKQKAIIQFNLSKGNYATNVIRELLKTNEFDY